MPVRRRAAGGLEFLLVRTSNGERWTFPKGGASAARRSRRPPRARRAEEAGVAGAIGAEPLGEYRYARGSGSTT